MIVTLILVRMVEDAQMVSIVTLVPAQLVTLGNIATQVSQECNFVNCENIVTVTWSLATPVPV